MVAGVKRKRPSAKGLAPGERLERDNLAGADLYSRWGWVSRISDPSQITAEHLFATYGFNDKVGMPICQNKYSVFEEQMKKRKVDMARQTEPTPVASEEGDDVIVVSSDDEKPSICNKKRCKGNPQCLNYLGQAKLDNEDGALQAFLKSSHLGPSPLNDARELGLPVGLKVWFQHHAFRDGVYKCKASQDEGRELEDSPIFQLQVTFAALQESTQNVFNPVKLVESLQLRVSEQQDAQEFSKLFMSHLATEFEKQAVPSLKTLVADQFEGRQTYVTMCQNCRHHSERDADFLELEINLETDGKLEERIQALLQSEQLTGDNKYFCTRCGNLQNAIRYTKLRRLPPVLHFSVLRFVFDLATLTRKKSKQIIQFPSTLDMSPFIDTEAQSPMKTHLSESEIGEKVSDFAYELRGVLLHKGPSAYHGHYEAQVFDVTSKQFYQFNDETVTPVASLLSKKDVLNDDKDAVFRNGSTSANKLRRTYAKKKRRVDDSDHELENNIRHLDHTPSYISSKDAYMLIYVQREPKLSGAGHHPLPEPPPLARQRVADLNKTHDIACASYTERVAKVTTSFTLLRQRKMEIYRQWQINDFQEESGVVSRRTLEDWLMKGIEKPKKKRPPDQDNDAYTQQSDPSRQSSKSPDFTKQDLVERSVSPPDPLDLLTPALQDYHLDNSSIVCRHGGLDPKKAGEMKRIKKDTMTTIRTETGCIFDPEMTTGDICHSCVRELFLEKRYALDHSSQVARFDEFCKTEDDAEGAWISKAWLKDWRQDKPKMHVVGKADPAPDAPEYASHVKCVHDQLSLSSSTRKWVNGPACAFLQSLFPTWSPMVSRSPDLHIPCPACNEDFSLSREMRQTLKQQVDREKDKLRNIMSPSVLALDPEIIPGVRQVLISSDFLRQWRAWISRPHERPRPGPVDNTWLICKHGWLIIDPNVRQDLGPSISLISLADWEILQELYGGGPLITLTGLAQQDSQESDCVRTVFHDLEVCQECRSERLSNFETASITVRILGDGTDSTKEQDGAKDMDISIDAPRKTNNGKIESLPNRGRKDGQPLRTSSRLRNSKRNAGKKSIIIQKLSTVKDIKIQLHDELHIPTICQRLFFKGKELIDNSATVASLGILAHDVIDLREEKENDDAMNTDTDTDPNRAPREESRAFGGTILSGVFSIPKMSSEVNLCSSPEVVSTPNHCPACTYINPDNLSICHMCGSAINI